MIERQEWRTNHNGHQWELNEDGELNQFALDYEFCNGPRCVLCGLSFCEHHDNGMPLEYCSQAPLSDCPWKEEGF